MKFDKKFTFLDFKMTNGDILSVFSSSVKFLDSDYEVKEIKVPVETYEPDTDTFVEKGDFMIQKRLEFSRLKLVVSKVEKEVIDKIMETKDLYKLGFDDGENYLTGNVKRTNQKFELDENRNLIINIE